MARKQIEQKHKDEFITQILALTLQLRQTRDLHHLCNRKNFGVDDGHLTFLDYADKTTQEIIIQCGDEIYEKFVCP